MEIEMMHSLLFFHHTPLLLHYFPSLHLILSFSLLTKTILYLKYRHQTTLIFSLRLTEKVDYPFASSSSTSSSFPSPKSLLILPLHLFIASPSHPFSLPILSSSSPSAFLYGIFSSEGRMQGAGDMIWAEIVKHPLDDHLCVPTQEDVVSFPSSCILLHPLLLGSRSSWMKREKREKKEEEIIQKVSPFHSFVETIFAAIFPSYNSLWDWERDQQKCGRRGRHFLLKCKAIVVSLHFQI